MFLTWVNLSKMGVVEGSLDKISIIKNNFTRSEAG